MTDGACREDGPGGAEGARRPVRVRRRALGRAGSTARSRSTAPRARSAIRSVRGSGWFSPTDYWARQWRQSGWRDRSDSDSQKSSLRSAPAVLTAVRTWPGGPRHAAPTRGQGGRITGHAAPSERSTAAAGRRLLGNDGSAAGLPAALADPERARRRELAAPRAEARASGWPPATAPPGNARARALSNDSGITTLSGRRLLSVIFASVHVPGKG